MQALLRLVQRAEGDDVGGGVLVGVRLHQGVGLFQGFPVGIVHLRLQGVKVCSGLPGLRLQLRLGGGVGLPDLVVAGEQLLLLPALEQCPLHRNVQHDVRRFDNQRDMQHAVRRSEVAPGGGCVQFAGKEKRPVFQHRRGDGVGFRAVIPHQQDFTPVGNAGDPPADLVFPLRVAGQATDNRYQGKSECCFHWILFCCYYSPSTSAIFASSSLPRRFLAMILLFSSRRKVWGIACTRK